DQIDPEVRPSRRGDLWLGCPGPGRDDAESTRTGNEVALRDELVVGGDDRGPCELEASGADRSPKCGLQAPLLAGRVDLEQKVTHATGLEELTSTGSGPESSA